MEVTTKDDDLLRMLAEDGYYGAFDQAITKAFRKRVPQLMAAVDVRDLSNNRGMNFEELKGDRVGEYSIRLNKKYRLIFTMDGHGKDSTITITKIEDYH